MFKMDSIRGGSPYGAGVYAGDGSREPSESELALAEHQGKYMATVVKKLAQAWWYCSQSFEHSRSLSLPFVWIHLFVIWSHLLCQIWVLLPFILAQFFGHTLFPVSICTWFGILIPAWLNNIMYLCYELPLLLHNCSSLSGISCSGLNFDVISKLVILHLDLWILDPYLDLFNDKNHISNLISHY